MSLFGKLFGAGQQESSGRSMQEEALTAIDSMNAQIAGLEADPNLSDAQKAEQIALLEREIKRFSDAMGWKHGE
ncbi:MAG: hypothetical protein IJ595_02240 [Oscillospiraceae bacterium]|nr:hypothetical protein [Oscillospiraceae bacterium]